MYYNTEAVVIRSFKSGERDRVLRLLTKDFGNIACVVRGIRKLGHKFGSNMELFSCQEIMLYRRQQGSMYVITASKVKNMHYELRKDFEKFNAASIVLEAINKFIPDESTSFGQVFDLLMITLDLLEKEGRKGCIISWFLLQLMYNTGYEPVLEKCVHCDDDIKNLKIKISPKLGGVVCAKCSQINHQGDFFIDKNTYRVIRGLLLEKDANIIAAKCNVLTLSREKDVYAAVIRFVEYHCDMSFKTVMNYT